MVLDGYPVTSYSGSVEAERRVSAVAPAPDVKICQGAARRTRQILTWSDKTNHPRQDGYDKVGRRAACWPST